MVSVHHQTHQFSCELCPATFRGRREKNKHIAMYHATTKVSNQFLGFCNGGTHNIGSQWVLTPISIMHFWRYKAEVEQEKVERSKLEPRICIAAGSPSPVSSRIAVCYGSSVVYLLLPALSVSLSFRSLSLSPCLSLSFSLLLVLLSPKVLRIAMAYFVLR